MNPKLLAFVVIVAVAAGAAIVIWMAGAEMRAAWRHPAVQGGRVRDEARVGGVEGADMPRLHGRGVVALIDDELVFVMASPPHHVLRIAVHQVTTVDLTSALRLRGRWLHNRRHWLRVRWQTGTGVATIGFVVPDPALWARVLRHASHRDTSG